MRSGTNPLARAAIPLQLLAALALAVYALALAVPGDSERDVGARVLATRGALSMTNSAGGGAILAAERMRPGTSVEGTVEIANTGDLDGQLALAISPPLDAPGPSGAPLSRALRLEILDVSGPGAPVAVYSGPLAAADALPLGAFAAGARRTLRFVATLPLGGRGDDAYQGARATVRFDWTATAGEPEAGIATGGRAGVASLRLPAGQRPLRNGRLTVVTRCASPCAARLALTVQVPGARRLVDRAARDLPAGTSRVTLRLSRRTLAAIRARLARGGSVRGRLTLALDESSGRELRAARRVRFELVRR